jgi:hypothetical protein
MGRSFYEVKEMLGHDYIETTKVSSVPLSFE